MRGWLSAFFTILAMILLAGCGAPASSGAGPTPTPVLLPAGATAAPTAGPTVAQVTSTDATPPATAGLTATPIPTAPPAATAAPRLLAIGLRATTTLRGGPGLSQAVVAQRRGSETLWAEGRSADGKWLWTSYGDAGEHGWLALGDAKVFGDVATLPVVTATVAAPTPSAQAAAPAAPRLTGKIALQTASGGDIYLVNADGTGLRRVADGLDPALSPDGTRLAYARWREPEGVYVVDLRTGVESQIVTASKPRSPTWSPDGSKLAFTHVVKFVDCRQTPFGCYTDEQLRSMFGGQDCVETPNGRICISDFTQIQMQHVGLVRVNADGGGWQDLSGQTDAQALAWHPGRDELLFRTGSGLQLTAPDAAPWQLVADGTLGSPAWSPDGQRIAVQKRMHDHSDIFILDANGQVAQRLTAPPDDGARAPNNVAPAWAPDGKSLLFFSDRDGAWRLYRMNVNGSGQALFLPNTLKGLTFRYDFAAERMVSWGK